MPSITGRTSYDFTVAYYCTALIIMVENATSRFIWNNIAEKLATRHREKGVGHTSVMPCPS